MKPCWKREKAKDTQRKGCFSGVVIEDLTTVHRLQGSGHQKEVKCGCTLYQGPVLRDWSGIPDSRERGDSGKYCPRALYLSLLKLLFRDNAGLKKRGWRGINRHTVSITTPARCAHQGADCTPPLSTWVAWMGWWESGHLAPTDVSCAGGGVPPRGVNKVLCEFCSHSRTA